MRPDRGQRQTPRRRRPPPPGRDSGLGDWPDPARRPGTPPGDNAPDPEARRSMKTTHLTVLGQILCGADKATAKAIDAAGDFKMATCMDCKAQYRRLVLQA